MGVRKRNSAERRSEALKEVASAKLNNVPTSPRKMRLVADMIRGMEVRHALNVLEHSPREASDRLYKVLKSAIANWEKKKERSVQEDDIIFVKEIQVNGGRMLKRLQTAPQGRAYRVRKRSNHVNIILGERSFNQESVENS